MVLVSIEEFLNRQNGWKWYGGWGGWILLFAGLLSYSQCSSLDSHIIQEEEEKRRNGDFPGSAHRTHMNIVSQFVQLMIYYFVEGERERMAKGARYATRRHLQLAQSL